MSGMTFRQIAELCGVDRSTVIRWGAKVKDSAERTEIDAKCTEADQSKEPALLSLPAILATIRAGGKNTLADLLEQNAVQKSIQSQVTDFSTMMRELIPAMASAVALAVTSALRGELGSQPSVAASFQPRLSLPSAIPNGDYFTIKAYGGTHGLQVTRGSAFTLGREAARVSRERNVEIRKVEDEQWGQVNSYHVAILKEVFTL